jgi:peptidoglycan/LPS O-acetylase OafA/YrhL
MLRGFWQTSLGGTPLTEEKIGRIRELDWLRGYAVSVVIVLHIGLIAAYGTPASQLVRFFNLAAGVDIFFAISGFVISQVLFRYWVEKPDAAFYRRFMWARFLRLWPALAFWSVVVALGAVVFKEAGFWPTRQQSLVRAVAAIFYVSNFVEAQRQTVIGLFWSLAVEWQFYVVFPLALLLVRANWARLLIISLIFALGIFWRPGLMIGGSLGSMVSLRESWPSWRSDCTDSRRPL